MAPIESGGVYKIVNAQTPEIVVDLSAGDGLTITGYPYNEGPNQHWRFINAGEENQWLIQSTANEYFIVPGWEAIGDDSPVHAQVDPWTWTILPAEEFGNPEEEVRIFAQPEPIFNLDLSNYGDDAAGTPIKIWGRNGENKNQAWRLERVG